MSRPATTSPPETASRPYRAAVIGLMAFLALAMWTVNPLFWAWVTSSLQDGTQPSMGPYALLLLGFTLTAVGLGRVLALLNRHLGRVTGTAPMVRVIVPWRRSLRGGRDGSRETDGRLPVSVLDVVMVGSVVIAVAAFLTWYLLTNPTPPNVGGPGPSKDY